MKHQPLRVIDQKPALTGPGSISSESTYTPAPPAPPSLPACPAPALATGVSQSDRSATAYINASWTIPAGLDPELYDVQYATDSAFSGVPALLKAARPLSAADAPSTFIGGLTPDRDYWVRVAAIVGGIVGPYGPATSIRTAQDTTPAAPVSAIAITWDAPGNAVITWTNPDDPRLWRCEVVIRATNASGALIVTDTIVGTRYDLAVATNRAMTGGVTTIHVGIRTQTYAGTYSLTATTATSTKPRPGNVASATQSWSNDDGTASATWRISWPAVATASRYALTIDGVTRRTTDTLYVMTEEDNRAIHAGVLDPTISYSLVAEDDLGQTSVTPLTGVATNVAPPAPTITVNPTSFNLVVTVTSARPADLAYATVEVLRNGSVLVSGQTTDTRSVWQLGAAGSYSVRVSLTDVFGQTSAATTSVAISLEPLSVESLREGIEYEDDEGTDITILRRLKDDTTATGVSYSA